jgi:hypothetical protein
MLILKFLIEKGTPQYFDVKNEQITHYSPTFALSITFTPNTF